MGAKFFKHMSLRQVRANRKNAEKAHFANIGKKKNRNQMRAALNNLQLAHETAHRRKTWKLASAAAAKRNTSEIAREGLRRARRKKTGICEICKSKCFPHQDHDHRTGRLRGILCFTCNCGIGLLKDSKDLLEKAAKYLEKYEVKRFPRKVIRFPRLKIAV